MTRTGTLAVDVRPAVAAALSEGRPVVALESTIVTHGMPYPRNLETALAVEEAVREAGAVPATIAVLGGRPTVGLGEADLAAIARAGRAVPKLARRELPVAVARRQDGSTTVSATMACAAAAGIAVLATGGIGGVHRDAERTFDVSSDLTALATVPVAVVCSGAKAILDLPRTLEALETLGVPVIGLGTSELPAFYTRRSGLPLSLRAETPAEAAGLVRAGWESGLWRGVVVANPVPAEAEADASAVARAIEAALEEAARAGAVGPAVTPFLLERVEAATGGASLAANVALIVANAAAAAGLARALGG